MRLYWLLILGLLVAGCDRETAAPQNTALPETEGFFVDWLKGHGETNVVVDAKGVGVAGNTTRLKASLHKINLNNGSYVAEVEFNTSLPGGGMVVDFIAGIGETEKLAVQDAMANFILTTFHVIYKVFLNNADEHQTLERMTFANGERQVALGNLYLRSSSTNHGVDLEALGSEIRKALTTLSPSPTAHWIKIVYGQNKGETISFAVIMDNELDLTDKMTSVAWPKLEEFYLVKQFIIIQPSATNP